MHPSLGSQSKIATLTLALMLVTLWLLLHGYQGLTGDAQIYAFQAMARILPQLNADLYLQNTSQDQFTVFSPFYAGFIGLLGVENAARLFTLLFTAWLFAAAFDLARSLSHRDAAWLAVAFLLIIAGDYGGAGVFRFSEPYLTARIPAEALIVTALACHYRGMRRLAALLGMAALIIHPLIALPGLLLLACLWLPERVSALAAIGAVLAVAAVALIVPALSHLLTVMDASWLEVVRERSQFLFLQLWSVRDFEVNALPFITLGFMAVAVSDPRIRQLCTAAALVGAAGLALAFIGGGIGPIALLVQGQAWRWVWITVFVSAVLLPVALLQVWQDEKCGPLCVMLLICGWTLPAVDGMVCVSLALLAWAMRARIGTRLSNYLRCASMVLGGVVLVWILIKSRAIVSPPSGPAPATALREFFGLRIPAALFAFFVWGWIHRSRSVWVPRFLSLMLAAMAIAVLPAAFKQARTLASPSDLEEFSDWRGAIPPTSTVLVAPARDVGAFVWFTLQRPNYLALDQSAGVVFSRATALEVRRRSQILLPVMDPNWKILAQLRASAADQHAVPRVRPLTAAGLVDLCADPGLGFVIAPQDVGFDPLPHGHSGAWKDWKLYDCRKVRPVPPAP